MKTKKAFGLWSAVFLGIGSMVGAGIFVLLGEAGAIAGNLVWISFILGGIIAIAMVAKTFGNLRISYDGPRCSHQCCFLSIFNSLF